MAFVIDAIKAIGVSVKPSSRLDRMLRAVANSDGTPKRESIGPGSPDFEIALEAVRDLHMLKFIFEQIKDDHVPKDFQNRILRLLKDAALPQDNPSESKGRDVQCELFIAAICVQAGLKPAFAEPDLCCLLESHVYGVAIKRIKSFDRLEDRIKNGAQQLGRTGLPGCIVADISVALNPENDRMSIPVDDATYERETKAAMERFSEAYFEKFRVWSYGKGVQGVVILDYHVRLHPTDGWGLMSTTAPFHLSLHNQRRRQQFEQFVAKYAKGIPADTMR